MISPVELDLFSFANRAAIAPEPTIDLRSYLASRPNDWRTRAQICGDLHCNERAVREAAEALGSEIVRGQEGFKLTQNLSREDLGAAKQASDAFLSQGKRMIRYALALKRKLHQRI